MSNDISGEISVAAAKVTPIALVAAWGPQEWMYLLTSVYVVAQLSYLLWKWRREARAKAAQ